MVANRRNLLRFAALAGGVGALVLGIPLLYWSYTAWTDTPATSPTTLPQDQTDDASRLNHTRVAQVFRVSANPVQAEAVIRQALKRAIKTKAGLSIAGARHSMGGQTVVPGGVVLDMSGYQAMQRIGPTLVRIQAGAHWSQIIPWLNQRGLSVGVMQSSNDFSLGGSMSVNAHGWQYNRPPLAVTVDAFRLMMADGSVKTCSRQQNPELFKLVLGGYGLFGVILEVDLQVIPNNEYTLTRLHLPTHQFMATFAQKRDPAVGMFYGRLNVSRQHFLQDALMYFYQTFSGANLGVHSDLQPDALEPMKRVIFRGSVGNDFGKELRWFAEKSLGENVVNKVFSRNELLQASSKPLEDRSPHTTDILHEYFVPLPQFDAFVARMQQIIPRHRMDLLNITVRHVLPDTDAFLRYASTEMMAFVMLYNQKRDGRDESDMQALTQELIQAALDLGGTYYLPYRLHASMAQFQRAYPQAKVFFKRKRHYDPQDVFRNQWYLKYRY